MFKKFVPLIIVFGLLALPTSVALADKPIDKGNNGKPPPISERGKSGEVGHKGQQSELSNKGTTKNSNNETGFDEFGYNRTARIFNGTAWDWCMEKVGDEDWCTEYLGDSKNDKLIMKWNAEWDRGVAENWSLPPYNAWENNQWNGKVPGGSGSVWHYKIVWVGDCVAHPELLTGDSYCIWGQFAVIMDQGTDGGDHIWVAHGVPSGYGSYRSKP